MKFETIEDPTTIFLELGYKRRGGSLYHFIKVLKKEIPKTKIFTDKYGKDRPSFYHLIIKQVFNGLYMCDIHIDIPTLRACKGGYKHGTISSKCNELDNEFNNIIRKTFTGKLENVPNIVVNFFKQKYENKNQNKKKGKKIIHIKT